jgi:hypothetical protein
MDESASGIEQAEKIIYFGERADSTSGIDSATALVDGNGRLQTGDTIYVGSVELPQKLPGMERERFEVLPLSFGKDGVEDKRTFPAAARTGNGDELIAGNLQRQILEIVCSRPFNADEHVPGALLRPLWLIYHKTGNAPNPLAGCLNQKTTVCR